MRSLADAVGLTLLHSIWEIGVVGLVLWVALRLAPKTASHLRYLASITALLLCCAIPLVTLTVIRNRIPASGNVPVATLVEPRTRPTAPVRTPNRSQTQDQAGMPVKASSIAPSQPETLPNNQSEWPNRPGAALPYLAAIWAIGVLAMSVRLLGGMIQVRRLRRSAAVQSDGALFDTVARIARKFGIRGSIWVGLSGNIESPMTVGILKTAILLPASMLTRLSTTQIEALICHEVAHIRRNDSLVNGFQAVAETVFFYHPLLWWISNVIRREREHCCDEMAATVIADRRLYAQALLAMEEVRQATPRLALSARDGELLQRVRRLLSQPTQSSGPASGLSISGFLLCLCIIGCLAAPVGLHPQTAPRTSSQTTETIRGRVVDLDGRPVGGATVVSDRGESAHQHDYRVATSGADGQFEFNGIGAGEFRAICAYKKGSGFAITQTKADGADHIKLELGPTTTAELRVLLPDWRPTKGTTIQLAECIARQGTFAWFDFADAPNSPFTGITDGAGVTRIEGLPQGCSLTFNVDDPRFVVKPLEQPLIAGSDKVDLTLYLKPAASVVGRVTAQGVGLAGLEVEGNGMQPGDLSRSKTDANGDYRLDQISGGQMRVSVNLDEDLRMRYAFDSKEISILPESKERVDFALIPGVRVEGTVFDVAGKPVPKGAVLFANGFQRLVDLATADGTGHYVARLTPGSYRDMSGQTFSVGTVDHLDHDIHMQNGRRRFNRQNARSIISGRVLDAAGRGAPYAQVHLQATYSKYAPNHNYPTSVNSSSLSDVHGNFQFSVERFEGTADPTFEVLAAKGDLATPKPVRWTKDKSDVVIKRVLWVDLAGQVLDPSGKPIVGAQVFLQHASDWFKFELLGDSLERAVNHPLDFVSETDGHGYYHFRHLLAGQSVRVFAYRDRFGTEGRDVVLSDHSAMLIGPLRLPVANSFVDGQVVDTEGRPVPEALVAVVPLTQFVKADRAGKFHIEKVPPGTAQVHVMKGWAETDSFVAAGSRGNKIKIKLLPQTKTNPAYANEKP